MDDISIEIDGGPVDAVCGCTSRTRTGFHRYPAEYGSQIGSSERYLTLMKAGSGVGRAEFLGHMIEEFGTFIFGAYMDTIGRILGCERKPCCWVIVGVDAIREAESGIELTGKAGPFDPSRY